MGQDKGADKVGQQKQVHYLFVIRDYLKSEGLTYAPVMQEEIFGPILPVLTYENYEDLISTIQKRPTPLAFYLFTRNTRRIADWKYVLPFGGGCLNDTVIQLSNDHLPFGGMGASGMGQYHGKYGFDTFSHIKGLLSKKEWLDLPMRYNNRKDRLSFRLIRMFLH